MDTLLAGIVTSCLCEEEGERYASVDGYPASLRWLRRSPLLAHDRPRHPITTTPEKVADFDRNGWPASIGIGGRLPPEWVADFDRNTHVPSIHIRIEHRHLENETY